MDFRRSGSLDERRRRVLMDEIASPPGDQTDTSTGGSAKGPVRAYHESVLSQRQPKVTDLLPVRPLWVFVFVLLGLTGIAAIEAIHVHAVDLPLTEASEHFASLDARQRGSLAAWFSSGLLAIAAALAVIVFGIRAHRVDDYRGRYRVWLWTAAALAWLSLDAATGIHDAVALGLTLLAGKQVFTSSLAAGCTLTWIAVYGLAFGTLALRLGVEVWPSRLGFVALLQASLLYLTVALLKLQTFAVPRSLTPGLAESLLTLLAHFSLLAGVGLYARHVYLDATGRLKVHIDPDRKKSKRAKLKVMKTEKTEDTKPRPAVTGSTASAPAKFNTQPASASAPKSAPSITKSSVTAPADEDEGYDEDDSEYSNLSKSERRRLKKLARREQRRAA